MEIIRGQNIHTYFCKCNIKNAKLSRFGCGNSEIVWYKAGSISSVSFASTARIKSPRNAFVNKGSRNDRRKSLIVPQITGISIPFKFGIPLPRKNFS